MKKSIYILAVSLLVGSQIKAQMYGWSELGGLNALAANGVVYSVCSPAATGGNIYAGGGFTNGVTDTSGKNYVAKYNSTTWSELGGLNALGVNKLIRSICSDSSGNIYAAGGFEDDSVTYYVARYNGTTWSELGGLNALAANNSISSICSDNSGNIYAAGAFTNSSNKYYVAKYNGTTWSELGGLNGLAASGPILSVCSPAAAGGNIYTSGYFTNGSGNEYVAKYNGTSWSELGGANTLAANANINSLCTDTEGNIYAAGWFTNVPGSCYVAKYNGTTWSELGGLNGLAANAGIYSIYSDASGNIYAAGLFTNTSGKYYVAKYNGTSWSELGGANALAANGPVECVHSDASGNIYAAGVFTNASGKTYVARYGAITGINEITPTGSMNLFPNPTNNTVTISTGSVTSNAGIKVFNSTGEVVVEKSNQSGTQFILDLSKQSAGIYLVELREQKNVWRAKVLKTASVH